MNANLRNFALWVIIVLLLLALFTLFQNPGQRASSTDISFSQLLSEVDRNNVRDVVIQGPEIHGTFANGQSFQTYAPNDPTLVSRLYNGKVQITAKPPGDNVPWFVSLLVSWLPFIALIGVWIFLSRQMQGGAGKAMGFGKSRAKMLTEAHGRVTFEDVAGVDEAKQDLQEIVEFLRDPGKFQRLGGRIPRGVLLVGPPGTGKTLIARAVAGEANVPFFTISGSDFVEMFVGVGASRVRDMFEQAKKNAPCIIFIDEIDAVGRHRGAGLGGGNDEREQTLNQLLVEMDGFEANEGVILTAYHEAGHAIVGLMVPQHDPVHKVTIIPRGRALGITAYLPEGDKHSYTRQYCVSRLASVFGGREAELIIFGPENVTNGATGDIQMATRLARSMIMEWGMSDKLGRVRYQGNEQEVFLGHSVTQTVNM